MPGYEKIESLKNGGSWGKFWWKTCGFERVNTVLSSRILPREKLPSTFHNPPILSDKISNSSALRNVAHTAAGCNLT